MSERNGCGKGPGKVKTIFPLRLGIPQRARDSHFPTVPATTGSLPTKPLLNRMSYYDVCGNRKHLWPQVTFSYFQLPCHNPFKDLHFVVIAVTFSRDFTH
jgi:hypothetical protein